MQIICVFPKKRQNLAWKLCEEAPTSLPIRGWHGQESIKRNWRLWGGEAHCFMADEDVVAEARERGCTRAAICMERGAALSGEVIFAIGNAPTALIRLYEMIRKDKSNLR